MRSDENDLALLRQVSGAPSEAHDRTVLAAIDAAGQRIAARQRRRAPLWRIGLTLATAASLLLIPFWIGNQQDALRNSTNNSKVAPANASELGQAPEQFRWQAQANADAYRFTLRVSDGALLIDVTTDKTANSIALSTADRNKLLPGRSYFWVVDVDNPVQHQIGPFWFSIKPDGEPEPQ